MPPKKPSKHQKLVEKLDNEDGFFSNLPAYAQKKKPSRRIVKGLLKQQQLSAIQENEYENEASS